MGLVLFSLGGCLCVCEVAGRGWCLFVCLDIQKVKPHVGVFITGLLWGENHFGYGGGNTASYILKKMSAKIFKL